LQKEKKTENIKMKTKEKKMGIEFEI